MKDGTNDLRLTGLISGADQSDDILNGGGDEAKRGAEASPATGVGAGAARFSETISI